MTHIPEHGVAIHQLLAEMAARKQREGDVDWGRGRGWSLVYYGGEQHTRFLKEAYAMYFPENGLNATAFPSLRGFEAEVVRLVLGLKLPTLRQFHYVIGSKGRLLD